LGTASKGVDLFDRERQVFEHIDLGPEGNAAYVLGIDHDRIGNMWVATNAGLFKVTRTTISARGERLRVMRYFDKQCRITIDLEGNVWGYLMSSWAFRIRPAKTGPDGMDTLRMHGFGDQLWTSHRTRSANGSFVVDPSSGRVFGVFPYFIAEYDRRTLLPTVIHRVPIPSVTRLETERAHITNKGMMWIGANEVWRFDIRTGRMSRMLSTDPNQVGVMSAAVCTYVDRCGLVWIGTSGYGVLSYDPRTERFNSQLDGSVYWMQRTPDSRMVCQRPGRFLRVFDPLTGAYSIDRSDASFRSRVDGAIRNTDAALQDGDGIFWMCKGGLVRYDPRSDDMREFPIISEEGVVLDQVTGAFPLYMEGDIALWFGGDSAFFRFDKRSHHFKGYPYPITPDHKPYRFVQSIHQDGSGILWIGTVKGLLRLDPRNGGWTRFQNVPGDPASLSFDLIFTVHPDPQDPERFLWIGTNGGGLDRFDKRTGHTIHFTEKDGLPNDVIYGILDDAKGHLWMSTNKGLSRFDPATGRFRNFDAADGLQGDEFNRNSFCKLDDGRLFFGGINGFNYFDPQDLDEEPMAVDLVITDIKLINRSIDFRAKDPPLDAPPFLRDRMEIPYRINMVTFEFARMDHAAPRTHEYKYMLDGFDKDWILSGTNNSAIYTNLDPGEYVFHVRSGNGEGGWDEKPTSFALVVLPPWYRTWWFYGLASLLVLGAAVLYLRNLSWQRTRLERTVRVRTLELSREKDRSDELLRNILPIEVAAELKTIGRSEARHYEKATILFSDFEEFIKVGEKLSPSELVEELNVCFNAFDRIMEKYGVEKIKTIGDSYMAAGGVPDPESGKPIDVVLAGLEMQAIIAERRVEREASGRPFFQMRVGINTGPVVAGIVGSKKFQYDIWGDTVNIASRMESSGEVGTVNISASTHAEVKDSKDLRFTDRGPVQAKGKGELRMYFVDHREGAARPVSLLNGDTAKNDQQVRYVAKAEALHGLRVLLAEDNEFNVIVARGELEDLIPGVSVDVAQNGAIAVEMVQRNTYDLVLMDIQMPEVNGYEATLAIRALPGNRSNIPIVALTANTMQAERDRCREAGMDGFIPKPFKRKDLLGALQEVLVRQGA
jgi:class 3 adenylate cyclase/CheY-like chemotaxis protein/ligand-binding sensor domain-containing protein